MSPAPDRKGRAARAPAEWLPPEIADFLSGPSDRTLTVRGPPGSGKTTFALAALEQFNGYRAFVTARVPRATILRDHPWIARSGASAINVAEYLRFRGTDGTLPGLRVGQLRDALQARATDLVELSTVLSLPKELEESMVAHEGEPKFLAIDSWEAWVENVLGSTPGAFEVPTTRWELERSLLDRFRDLGVHVLLVVERDDRSQLDYVADGALSLTVTETDGRADRWISFQKLRGVQLRSVSYPFTLEGGRFRCIRPAQFHSPLVPAVDEPDPEPELPGVWPGSVDLASQFGRLPIPGSTLLEADGETPVRLLWRLIVPMIASALRSGGRVVVRPPSHLSSNEIWGALKPIRASVDLEAALRILSSESENALPGAPEGPFLRVSGEGLSDARRSVDKLDSAGFFRGALPPTARSLVVLFVDSPLEPAGEAAGPEPFLALAGLARRTGTVGIVLVARSSDAFIEPIRARSALHLLLHASRGQFFLTGVRPWTPHFALTLPSPKEGSTHYGLVPIV